MNNELTELMRIIKKLPEKGVKELLEEAKKIKKESENGKKEGNKNSKCVNCGSEKVVKNGKGHGKQSYKCRECGKSFSETNSTIIEKSHNGEAVWKQVIADTINGVSIDKTAENLNLYHATVFNMRHKILYGLEQEQERNPVKLEGVSEVDECYILNSYKGKKLSGDGSRKPRKHVMSGT